MQEERRKEFVPLVSKPCWIITWLIRIFGIAILLVLFIVLSVFPFLVCEGIEVLVVIAILYYPIWSIAMYRFFRFLKKARSGSVIRIMVDDKGIHYDKVDGSRDEILYSQLERSYLSEEYEVNLTSMGKTWVLAVGVNGNVTRVMFETDPGYSYYTKNSRALRARFIEGITCFRRDLKIDPFVFEEFCIHPEKFTFDRKRYMKHIFQAAVIVGIILLIGLVLLFIITSQ